MIRPFTLLCFCAFAGAGAWLYQVKHSVSELDKTLIETRRQTEQARQRIDILRAEWALLNEPERLRQTATRVLTLEGMQPQHFARMGEFERRLPAAIAFAGPPNLFEIAPAARQPEATVMLASAAAPRPATQAAATAPAPQAAPQAAAAQPAAPAAAARGPEAPAPQALAAAVAQQRAEIAAQQRAEVAPRPAPRPAPPAPRPIQPAVHVTPAPPPRAEPVRVARTAPTETSVASALGGAAIGGARPLLPPPVPVSPAAAATLDGMRGASAAR